MEENIQPIPLQPVPEFHLGLTMAGAASAGCYTAGVMDYLFEILDLWEKAKIDKDNTKKKSSEKKHLPQGWNDDILQFVPEHKVIIDAMGGTSAGGMTTIMASIYALKGVVNPVNDPANRTQKKNNVLYDSWVLMGDEVNKPHLLEKTLDTRDLNDTGKIQSLLNSDFIDSICDDAFSHAVKDNNLPDYFAKNLEVVLSHTMLRSVPLAVDFNTPIAKARKNKKNPEHNTFDHFTISHFKLDYDPQQHKDRYLPLTPYGLDGAKMKLATKATGAFPIGLRFREFFLDELTKDYIQDTAEKIVFNRVSNIPSPDIANIKWPGNFPNPFNFVSIDGGAVNNEPFGEVLRILKERYNTKKPTDDYKYALIMIDPFPDIVPKEKYKQPDDLFSVVPAIIGTLWDQAKVKRAEMLDAYSSDYYRGEIFPVRYSHDKVNKKFIEEDHKIACGAAMAFSGFLDIDFRHHDFFLGRDNARNFCRTYFTLEYRKDLSKPEEDIIHPIHKDWTPAMVAHFKMPGNKEKGTVFLPIIPDLYYLKEQIEKTYQGPFHHTVKDWPEYDPEKLFSLKVNMKERVKKMLELAAKKAIAKEKGQPENETPLTEKWMKQEYRSNFIQKIAGKIGGAVLGLMFLLNKGKIANRITKAAFKWILKDLEAKGLLKK